MSRLSVDTLKESVTNLLNYSKNEKKRNFLETIELQIALKNYDPDKDKRFSGVLRLPAPPKLKTRVCVIGSEKHCDEAKAIGIDALNADDITKLKKDKKKVKKLAQGYDAFLSSADLIKKIPRLMGPGLSKAGKFPTALGANEDLKEKIEELKSSVKFQLKSKKSTALAVAVANVGMSEDEVIRNIVMSVNFLVSLLKKNWQNVRRLYIKSTMGPSHKIYGF